MLRVLDKILGRPIRHLLFVLTRSYYALFYNVSCSNKHLLQDIQGALILATHVSRHDGPLIASVLYTTCRIRPTAHYKEYHSIAQWLPMYVTGTIPMSSPKSWPPEKRQARRMRTLEVMRKVLNAGNSILLFPAGRIRRQPEELIPEYLTGTHEILNTVPDVPVVILHIDGLGKFQDAKYDGFWSFIGLKKGRRHVSLEISISEALDPTLDLAAFNKRLENTLNKNS